MKSLTDAGILLKSKYQVSFILSFLLIVLLLQPFSASGQGDGKPRFWVNYQHPVKFEYLSVEQGLSQASVLCILQDRRGFMWFGSEDGLNKYDGYNFEVYKFEPGNPHTIASNVIWCLLEDRGGTLWVGSNGGGLSRYDREQDRFRNFRAELSDVEGLPVNDIRCMLEDRDGVIWLGASGGGLCKMLPLKSPEEAPRFATIRPDSANPRGLSSDQISKIFQDSRGVIWIGTEGGGLNKMISGAAPGEAPAFIRYRTTPDRPATTGLDFTLDIEEDEMGLLWICTMNGLLSFNPEKEIFTRYTHQPGNNRSPSHNLLRRIYKDRAGMLWIGADGGGINKLIPGDTENDAPSFICYRHDPHNVFCLSNDAVESIYEDRSGNLWIGVYNGGLNKLIFRESRGLEREAQEFPHYKAIANNPDSLSHNHVNAIVEDLDGHLWVGTDGGGLNKIIPGQEETPSLHFSHYRARPGVPGAISDDIVTALAVDRKGTLWVGTFTGGLNRRIPPGDSRKTDSFQNFRNQPDKPDSINGNFVRTIYEDGQQRLWIGLMDGGLDLMDQDKGCFFHYVNDPADPHSLVDNNVFAVQGDRSGRLWVGTVSGLSVAVSPLHYGGAMNFSRSQHRPDDPHSLGNNFVRAIFEDSSGVIWVGANGGGLNKLLQTPKGSQNALFKRYSTADGLPNDVVHGILEDDDGFLWLSTNKGLSRFNPGAEEFRNFDFRDGLQGDQFNGGSCYKSKTGEMFFGGNNGFNIFHPLNVRENPVIPPIALTRLLLFNRPVPVGLNPDGRRILNESITETKRLTLSHKDSVISFEFAALHFVNPLKNRYAYIMEGLESEWNHVGNRRFVTYTTLPPGDYTFRVIASNNDGVWNNQGVSLAVTVTPPYYKTWWFRAMLGFLLAGMILGVHQYRVRRIIYHIEKKYEKTAIKPEKADEYLKILLHCMECEKPHLDPELTLHKLSERLSIPYHVLSQIINGKLDKIFFDFINEYRVNEAIGMLTSATEESRTILDIAAKVGFNSQSAFNRAFKKHTQQTPSDFLIRHRIQEAVKKLSDPACVQLAIPQIAKSVGFSTQSSFNRAFKKITGKTPSQYKKNA